VGGTSTSDVVLTLTVVDGMPEIGRYAALVTGVEGRKLGSA
jgi:hypothetical protein